MGDPLTPASRRWFTLSHPPAGSPLPAILGLPEPEQHWRARFGDGQGKANQTAFSRAFNHHGTHIDAPLHLFAGGRSIADFAPAYFIFEKVGIALCPKQDGEEISGDELTDVVSQRDCELLLVKTGFERHRAAEPRRYVEASPGFAAGTADRLRRFFPALRAVGFDLFSVENVVSGRAGGFPAHKAFLRDPPLLPIEDMRLADIRIDDRLRVFAIPLLLPTEAMPVTVLAETV